MVSLRKTARQVELFIIYRILHADDTPHRLALGIALGFLVAWTPTIGFQMVLVVLLAAALRANTRVGLPVVWISNPFTLIPIYLPNYWFGNQLLRIFTDRPPPNYAQFREVLAGVANPSQILAHFYEASFWSQLGRWLFNISLDLWLGSLVIGLVMSLIAYIVSYKVIVWYRTKHPRARQLFALLRRRKLNA